jgi:hypothetical protein
MRWALRALRVNRRTLSAPPRFGRPSPITASYAASSDPWCRFIFPHLEQPPAITVRRPTRRNPLPVTVRQTDME